MMKVELKKTEDNSHTLYVPQLEEHYHSTHGAIQESKHVFIEAGLNEVIRKQEISIFEVGFGTGLNALLTLLRSKGVTKVNYCTVEKYPLDKTITQTLNYAELLPESNGVFSNIHEADWNEKVWITKDFCLEKNSISIHDFTCEDQFDLIYFDAFAPEKQPDMWTCEVFSKIVKLMKPGAVFTTYCAKGKIRRMLQDFGLIVERLPGPPGKREMLRGLKR